MNYRSPVETPKIKKMTANFDISHPNDMYQQPQVTIRPYAPPVIPPEDDDNGSPTGTQPDIGVPKGNRPPDMGIDPDKNTNDAPMQIVG